MMERIRVTVDFVMEVDTEEELVLLDILAEMLGTSEGNDPPIAKGQGWTVQSAVMREEVSAA